uniref:sterol 14alpha-demethylase n=1 Tax=Wickerhamiella domercqiae TaxID=45788 RepID=A0A0A7DZ71_WICDO|nr:cytochrome P450 monooxygenase CYP51 [Wickerhamiella domercqiae]
MKCLLEYCPFRDLPLIFSVPLTVALVLILAVAANLFSQLCYRVMFPYRAPIVPYLFPWVGSAVSYGQAPYEFFEENRKKYGDIFAFVLCGRVMTVCLGPRGHDFVFNAKLADVSAEEAYKHLTTPVFGKGVIYDCPNSRLMEQKKFAKQALTRDAFNSYVPKIVKEVTDYMSNREKFPGPGELLNVLNVTPELTIYTASRTLMGDEMRAKFSKRTAQLYGDLDKGFKPLNFVFPNLPLPYYKRRDIAREEIKGQYLEVIKRRRTEETEAYQRDLIDAIMNSSTYRDGVQMTDEEIASLCIGILMGGQHTSAATSAWILLHLGQDTRYQDLLFEEQERVLQGHDLSYDDLLEMPLLTAIIRETLRLHAPLHSIFRQVMRPLPLPGSSLSIPKGHYVMVSPGHTHTHDDWFKEASRFYPERWLDTDEVEKLTHASKTETIDYGFGSVSKGASSPFLPFGAGRHRCIGEQFAMLQLGTIIITLVRKIKWTLPEGNRVPEIDFESMVTLPKDPADIIYTVR